MITLSRDLKFGNKDMAIFAFDKKVNKQLGVIKFPYPLKAYISL